MRDPNITRRILAKVDREEDVYIILDRVRQAIYDIDDYTGRLDARINALEQERVKFVTETGVNRIFKSAVAEEAIDWGKWAIRGTIGAASVGLAGWIIKLAWIGLHAQPL